MTQQETDKYDVVQQAAKAASLRQLKEARRDLIAYTKEYGRDPLVNKLGEQVEMLALNWKGK